MNIRIYRYTVKRALDHLHASLQSYYKIKGIWCINVLELGCIIFIFLIDLVKIEKKKKPLGIQARVNKTRKQYKNLKHYFVLSNKRTRILILLFTVQTQNVIKVTPEHKSLRNSIRRGVSIKVLNCLAECMPLTPSTTLNLSSSECEPLNTSSSLD